ncbi:hypothetical protein [Oceanomicrobium pacificus]|uniref:Uncharacterized protein n=1 Tax=Oceanomicrobium pacificus TaxID=2692916 RepID=A0A6B0TVZ6_9RHOB|nr:hypothetical protein [Oceanomicrobium pacificus]MXU65925.1 hypothetical protein [Oceanomicrobium pacificus]
MPDSEGPTNRQRSVSTVRRLSAFDRSAILETGVSEEELDVRLAGGERPDSLVKEFTPERWAERQLSMAKLSLKSSVRTFFELGVPKPEIERLSNGVLEQLLIEALEVVSVSAEDFEPFLDDESIVCPVPHQWNRFRVACGIRPGPGPLMCMILGGWSRSDEEKRERFEAQIDFAKQDRRNTERAVNFLRSLSDEDWHRRGQS